MNKELEELLKKHNRIYKSKRLLSQELESLIDQIFLETNIPKNTIRQIVSSQFSLINDVISSTKVDKKDYKKAKFTDYKSIRLIYLGTFKPSFTKFMRLKKIKENKK
jgi:hypothetical protein